MLSSTVCDMEVLFEKLNFLKGMEKDCLNEKEEKFLKILNSPVEDMIEKVSFGEIIDYINNFENYSNLFLEGKTVQCRTRLWESTKSSKCPHSRLL